MGDFTRKHLVFWWVILQENIECSGVSFGKKTASVLVNDLR